MDIKTLLQTMVDRGASDLHIGVPNSPVFRIHGDLVYQADFPPATKEDAENILAAIATPEQLKVFQEEKELDFAYSVPGLARFRVNALRQRGTTSIAFRFVPFTVPTIDDLELPQILKKLVLKPRGLILVTGHTGSGKSTTLAAMINHLNENDKRNIITIEEPVEFLHQNKKCIIYQREVGSDTHSFANALMHSLRHDPDVLVVGEMRDLATIATAITAAETGHLVLGTLHTYSAPQSVDRIIDIFPPDQQQQIRFQLSQVLEAILSQTLVHRIKEGRIAAFEILTGTQAVRNLIREEKIYQLSSLMSVGSRDGMQTLDQALSGLVRNKIIAKEEGLRKANDTELFEKWLRHDSA
ncbi:MAG: type IV pilus twitching motility protein PilT [Dehalococcoidales bacterium]|nr:type IV pilus twitching motility protein PilT [Dehalococcoidales bacterium]